MIAPKVLPRHVRACKHSVDETERWAMHFWKRNCPEVQCRVQYQCNSWRCPVCRRHEAAVTFARLKQACESVEGRGWCFLVLTLDRDGFYGGSPWTDVNEAYAALGKLTRKTLERIGRTWGPESRLERSGRSKRLRTVRKLGNRWFSVVEAHRSGWPHVNLVLWCPELAEELARARAEALSDPEVADAVELARDAWTRKETVPEAVKALARKASLASGAVRELLEDAGWGRQSTAEEARDLSAVISYSAKLCGLHESSLGELAKITQVPMAAPERFKRLRAGKGFLPPRAHNPEVTGVLVRRVQASAMGGFYDGRIWRILPVNPPKDPDQVPAVVAAVRAELQLIDEEARTASRNKGKIPPMPPVRIAIRGQLESHHETSERNWAMRVESASRCA